MPACEALHDPCGIALYLPEGATAGEPDSPPLFDRSTGEERQHADA